MMDDLATHPRVASICFGNAEGAAVWLQRRGGRVELGVAPGGTETRAVEYAADLSVGRQTEDSLTQELGVKTSWRLATALGTLEPEVTAAWVHDYLHGPIATSGVMGGEAFAVATPRIAADGARISVAATLVKSDRLSFRAEYDGELRAGYQSHTGLLKVLWQF